MKIAVACDHAGFELKDVVINRVKALGHEVIDLGTTGAASVDYPDFGKAAALAVINKQADRAIALCGSGVGIAIACNKFKGIRACVCHDTYSAAQGVEHDHMNIMCLGSRIIGRAVAEVLVDAYLNAKPSDDQRHLRRLCKVNDFENANMR